MEKFVNFTDWILSYGDNWYIPLIIVVVSILLIISIILLVLYLFIPRIIKGLIFLPIEIIKKIFNKNT